MPCYVSMRLSLPKLCPHCGETLRCVVDDKGVRYECKDYQFTKSYGAGVSAKLWCWHYAETGHVYTEPYDGALDSAIASIVSCASPLDLWDKYGKGKLYIECH